MAACDRLCGERSLETEAAALDDSAAGQTLRRERLPATEDEGAGRRRLSWSGSYCCCLSRRRRRWLRSGCLLCWRCRSWRF